MLVIIGVYFLLVITMRLPFVQSFLGKRVAISLSERIGADVEVGRVDLGLFNRLIIDDWSIKDQKQQPMIQASRLSVKIELMPLFEGNVFISSIQLFGAKFHLYKQNERSQTNFQFLLDSLASKDTLSENKIKLRINSLIIRNASLSYHQWDKTPTPSRFNPYHLSFNNINAHIALYTLSEDSVNLQIKKFALQEQSGIDVKKISASLQASKSQANVKDLEIILPGSIVHFGNITANYRYDNQRIWIPSLQVKGNILSSTLNLSDLGAILPLFKRSKNKVLFNSSFGFTPTSIWVNQLNVASPTRSFVVVGSGSARKKATSWQWASNVEQLALSASGIRFIADNLGKSLQLPPEITRLGSIKFKGRVGGVGKNFSTKGQLYTDAGNASLMLGLYNNSFKCNLNTSSIQLDRITNDKQLGKITAHVDIEGKLYKGKPYTFTVSGLVPKFDFKGYTYQNITLKTKYHQGLLTGKIAIQDPNIDVTTEGTIRLLPTFSLADIVADVRKILPHKLHLTPLWNNTAFSFTVRSKVEGKSLADVVGNVDVENFLMKKDNEFFAIDKFNAVSVRTDGIQKIDIHSDFGHIALEGNYDYATLPRTLSNIVAHFLPTLPGLPKDKRITSNNFKVTAEIHQSDWLQKLFDVPLKINHPIALNGYIKDIDKTIDMSLSAPDFSYQNKPYALKNLHIFSPGDTLHIEGSLQQKRAANESLTLDLHALASDNKLASTLLFNNVGGFPVKGAINTEADFYQSEKGLPTAHIRIQPSEVIVADSTWHIAASQITYYDKHLMVDNFAIEHQNQYLKIDGRATTDAEDSLQLQLNNLDVEYVLNLVNFHSVDFSGWATGSVVFHSLLQSPVGMANLRVDKFKFQDGDMGTLEAYATYDHKDGDIKIQANAVDEQRGITQIDGYVSPIHEKLDLNVKADNTSLAFVHSFCKSFMSDINARGNGKVRVYGTFKDVNLEGNVIASGQMGIAPLHTTYTLSDAAIVLEPNHIRMINDTIYDKLGQTAIINGDVSHNYLKDIGYNIQIKATNFLAYDTNTFGDNTFYGTVYATGNCTIVGGEGETIIDVDATPEKGTVFVYNADEQNTVVDNAFIRWTHRAPILESEELNTDSHSVKKNILPFDIEGDLRLNLLINSNPNAQLKIIMDERSGDYISLFGSGVLRASYYNKGSFDIYGNYTVDNGVYKLTIQDIISRDFTFMPGGTIAFGGDPYAATLNLNASYLVNGVNLDDVNIGKSIAQNNIRVNCIMNITGTPAQPKVGFNIDLPTINPEAKQMIYNVINSEEEMNQQVIYLLTIGRFYTESANNANNEDVEEKNRTSLAMQSILSGTISQQLNNLLSSTLDNNNWNFGANISTGNEGWNNAEYEAMLSGRLLNNRLLINGQFGYRDKAATTTNSFIGDFDIRYLLFPNGNLAIKVYNQTNDRYFTRNSLNTQGIGIILKKDFFNLRDLFGLPRRKKYKSPTR